MKQPFELPALLATQVNLVTTNEGWRIAFGEATSEKDSAYHTAIFIPLSVAKKLSDLLASEAVKI